MSAEEIPSEPVGRTPRPLPFPPRPSTAIGGGFTPRFQSQGFDKKSFWFGVFMTTVFYLGLVLIFSQK